MAVPSPARDYPATERLVAEAEGIIDAARSAGVTLRLTGGLAVRRYLTDPAFMDRRHSDIDLIAVARESGALGELLRARGYEENRYVSQSTGGAQLQFLPRARLLESRAHFLKRPHPASLDLPAHRGADHLDIFLDAMRMDHDLDVRTRLDIDAYAIPPADVLLAKLQIGRIAEKDVHDVIALLKDMPLGEVDDSTVICVPRLARVCARDWGMYHDLTQNLAVVLARLDDYALPDSERARVRTDIHALNEAIGGWDKPLRWRLRARIGTRLPWRRDVEERDGTPVVAPLLPTEVVLALRCERCGHAVAIPRKLAELAVAPLSCPRCDSLEFGPGPSETEEPAAA